MDSLVRNLRQHHHRATLAGLDIGVFIEAADRIEALEAELQKAREALEPLKQRADRWSLNSDKARVSISLGEIRRLCAALSQKEG